MLVVSDNADHMLADVFLKAPIQDELLRNGPCCDCCPCGIFSSSSETRY